MNINLCVYCADWRDGLTKSQVVVYYLLSTEALPPARGIARLERLAMQEVHQQFVLTVIFIKDQHSIWVAQCLEFDIAAQGKGLKGAQKALERTIMGQVALDLHFGRRPFEGIGQAPKEIWDMLDSSERLAERRPIRLPSGIPPAFMIASQEQYVWGY